MKTTSANEIGTNMSNGKVLPKMVPMNSLQIIIKKNAQFSRVHHFVAFLFLTQSEWPVGPCALSLGDTSRLWCKQTPLPTSLSRTMRTTTVLTCQLEEGKSRWRPRVMLMSSSMWKMLITLAVISNVSTNPRRSRQVLDCKRCQMLCYGDLQMVSLFSTSC